MAGTLVVVDDDESIRESLQLALELEGYRVETAGDGEQAFAWLQKNPLPCLLLLDLMMPVMDGWALLALLRADARYQELPVVIITAFGKGLSGAEHLPVLRKPVELDDLLRVVERHCGRA